MARCFPAYVLTGQLSSEWFTKSDVIISDSILCSGLTNSKPPLRPCSVAVSAAGTSKFKLNFPERVGMSLSLSWRMSHAQVAVGCFRDEKAKENWGRNYALYCVSVEVVVLAPVPAHSPWLGLGDHQTICWACPFLWQLLWMQQVVYVCII